MSDIAIVAVVGLVMVVAIVALFFGRGFRMNGYGMNVGIPQDKTPVNRNEVK